MRYEVGAAVAVAVGNGERAETGFVTAAVARAEAGVAVEEVRVF